MRFYLIEDTDGASLDYQGIELPELPLIERAEEWDISVKAIPDNYRCYGYFSEERKEIGLASKEESVFFHELAHCAHQRVSADFKDIVQWRKDIVAELAAAVLCKLVGKTSKHIGNHFQYISYYAKTVNLSPVKACIEVMGDVEKVLEVILNGEGIQAALATTPSIKGINR